MLSKALPFLLLPYLTRVLGVEGFGELSLTQSYISFILVFICLNADGALSRYYFRYGKRSVSLIFYASGAYSLTVAILGVIASLYFEKYILVVCFICCFFQNIVNIQLIYRQIQKKVISYLYIQFLSSFTSIIFTIIILEFFVTTYEGRIYGLALAFIVTGIIALTYIPNGFKLSINCTFRKLKITFAFIISFGIPLVFHNLSLFFKGQLDRFLVYNIYSAADLGIYATSFQVATVMSVLLLALNRATMPYYFEALKSRAISRAKIKQIIFLSFCFVPLPSLLFFLIPEFVYELVLGDGFGSVKIFCTIFLLGISMTLPYFIVVNYFFYSGRTKLISICSIASAILHVLLLLTIGSVDLIYTASCLFITNTFTFIFLYSYLIKDESFMELP